MPYRPDQRKYDQYAFLRWWCQNQWWVQIAVPCIICAGVIGALLYHWNSERQQKIDDEIVNAQFKHWKDNPPELDPDLDEKAVAWRVIRMKKNDPSMPIPYKKKQLIVKHWKEIIVDMKEEEIQRLHDLLQDRPVTPTDDISLDIRKFEAPWKDEVKLDDLDNNTSEDESDKVVPMKEDLPSQNEATKSEDSVQQAEQPVENDNITNSTTVSPQPTNNLSLPTVGPLTDTQPTASESTTSIPPVSVPPTPATPEAIPALPSIAPEGDASTPAAPATGALPVLEGADKNESAFQSELPGLVPAPVQTPAPQTVSTPASQASAPANSVGPLEDNYLLLMEQEKQKREAERKKRIEERKKNFDPDNFVPSSWKDKNLVI